MVREFYTNVKVKPHKSEISLVKVISMVEMSKEILEVINAVVCYGKYIASHNYIVPQEGFDQFVQMEEYYRSLPLPEGMDRNRADFEHILSIGWYSGKELERLNNTNFNDLHHTKWKS